MSVRRKIIIGLAGLLILCIAAAVFFYPRPVFKGTPDSVLDIVIIYYPYPGDTDRRIVLENVDSEQVVSCLSRYRERRTLSKAGQYALDDVELDITIVSKKGSKNILLGDINCSSTGAGSLKSQILNPEGLFEELKSCIGY